MACGRDALRLTSRIDRLLFGGPRSVGPWRDTGAVKSHGPVVTASTSRAKRAWLAVVAVVVLALLALVLVGLQSERQGGWTGPVVEAPLAPPEIPPTSSDDGLVEPDPAWLTAASDVTGIPQRALEAYVAATTRLSEDDSRCRISWNMLAGIGSVESVHGAFGGSRIETDGVARPPIIGIALDGDGVAAIRDTDDGALDGDTEWDRAVGPMQFIPETWQRWGADGDRDETNDPHDIDDAALAAARYLCDAGGDLTSDEGWSAAILTYNRSVDYAMQVSSVATEYATAR